MAPNTRMRKYHELSEREQIAAYLIEAKHVLKILNTEDKEQTKNLSNILVATWRILRTKQYMGSQRPALMKIIIRELRHEVEWLALSKNYPPFELFLEERRRQLEA